MGENGKSTVKSGLFLNEKVHKNREFCDFIPFSPKSPFSPHTGRFDLSPFQDAAFYRFQFSTQGGADGSFVYAERFGSGGLGGIDLTSGHI